MEDWGWRTETESPTRRRPRVRDGFKLFLDSFSPTHRLTSVPPSRRAVRPNSRCVKSRAESSALSPSLSPERSSLVRDERKRTEAVLLRCGHMQTTVPVCALWPAVLKGSVNRE